MKVFAYYYPGFHDDNFRKSGTEWNIVKTARPRDKRHYQPRIPVDGYYDQTMINTCKLQIKLAKQYGIDGFMICYYWDFEKSEPIMDRPLETLMEVIDKFDFEFNLMWVLRLPHSNLPIENGNYGNYNDHPWFVERIQSYRKDPKFEAEIKRITSHPKYRKDAAGRPIFQVYSVAEIIDLHGSKAADILSHFNDYHIQAVCGRSDDWIEQSDTLGINSFTTYVTLVDFNSSKTILRHSNCVKDQPSIWVNIKNRTELPFYPSVASGWDASPRGNHEKGFKVKKFPWSPVIIDPNPNDFADNLILAAKWAKEKKVDIHIASWNEWSEGHYIEPDQRFGYTFLEKVFLLKNN